MIGCSDDVQDDLRVQGVTTDSRQCVKKKLYFALNGDRFDGHDFVEEVLGKGASGAVVSGRSDLRATSQEAQRILVVREPLKALQDLALAYRKRFDFPIIAVTGSNGKTTTKEMIADVLQTTYRTERSTGNLNNHIGLPLSICSWGEHVECAVLEMGANHFGEIRRLCEIARPTIGLITNIGKAHLEFFRNQEGVAAAKGELLEGLGESGHAFLNGDDPYLLAMREKVKRSTLFGFGTHNDVRAEIAGTDEAGFPRMRFQSKMIRIPVQGRYNLYNGLAAAAVGLHLGVDGGKIIHALETFRSIASRMQVEVVSGWTVVNDAYNANPTSVKASLEAFRRMPDLRQRFVVLGDMLELGTDADREHESLGRDIAGMRFDGFYAYGPLMARAVRSAGEAGMTVAEHFDTKEDLVHALQKKLKKGDGILVKGSRSMRMEEVVDGLRPEGVCSRDEDPSV